MRNPILQAIQDQAETGTMIYTYLVCKLMD